MGATKRLFEDYNQQLLHGLIPQKSEPIETHHFIDPHEETYQKSFLEIINEETQKLSEQWGI